jgi:hypothetical protein
MIYNNQQEFTQVNSREKQNIYPYLQSKKPLSQKISISFECFSIDWLIDYLLFHVRSRILLLHGDVNIAGSWWYFESFSL